MNNLMNKLYWKIAALFIGMLILLGVIFIYMNTYYAEQYFQETNQRLNAELAQFTVDHVTTFTPEGEVDTTAIQTVMESMMVINPSVEVYLLSPEGEIITYVAPYKKVKLEQVNLAPVKDFIADKGENYVLGDDPRNPGGCKVFSAAPIMEEEQLKGYYYIILASEKQGSVASTLLGSYILRLGSFWFFLTLFGALALALFLIWYLTRNLQQIIEAVRRFKEGDYQARVANAEENDLPLLATTFNSMADQIVANIDELKSVEKLRRELIANVSHDLRTPLAIMRGYVETLQMKEETISSEDRQKYLSIILDSNDKLNKLVGQLFELSKLEANQVKAQKEPFFIHELAQDVFHKYQILADKKGIKIELNMDDKLPLVFADIALVERVMQNLMDNALKFTPKDGAVKIGLHALDKSVEIKVSDTGPGIPENEQSFIFERYNKNQAVEGNKLGTGLGLAIVKKILDIHNSTIEVISQPNKGATFFFQLPVYTNGVAV